MLTIETKIDAVEVQGESITGLPKEADQLIVSAHHVYPTLVVLDWHGRNITVSADELERAIRNACNHA